MYNKIVTIGNLTRDIEIKYLPNNTAIAKGAIATSHKYKTQSGEQKEEVCFIDFTIFGRIAEVANQYLHKGSKVMLEGRLQLDQWVDNQTGAKRSKHSLLVNEMKMLDSKGDSGYSNQEMQQSTSRQNQPYQTQPQQQNNTQYQEAKQNTTDIQIGDIPNFENNTDKIDTNKIPDDPNDWNNSILDEEPPF
ncbi:MAG: single-stranded DNA-binding protein [Campylobacterota bacterium]|nr:single-stranded DNA-binding protein [Campylobacterota bacterium]